MKPLKLFLFILSATACLGLWGKHHESGTAPDRVVYEGDKGPGKGKEIVFIASDHEYRSEEILPAWARILAKHYGFKCTVIFALDEEGNIFPGDSNVKNLDALKTADLLVLGLRFQDWGDAEYQNLDDYLNRGGPVIGVRTTTHAFKIADESKWMHYNFRYDGEKKDWYMGFGRKILGETWAGHYGKNHVMCSIMLLKEDQKKHPVLRGVKGRPYMQSGGYEADPEPNSIILADGQVLNGFSPTDAPNPDKELMPVAWVREYSADSGKTGKVFTTTHGAGADFLDDGFRRMLINASLWCLGMEKNIKANNPIDFVGPYQPARYGFGIYKEFVKPAMIEGWDTPIMPGKPKVRVPKPPKNKKKKKAD